MWVNLERYVEDCSHNLQTVKSMFFLPSLNFFMMCNVRANSRTGFSPSPSKFRVTFVLVRQSTYCTKPMRDEIDRVEVPCHTNESTRVFILAIALWIMSHTSTSIESKQQKQTKQTSISPLSLYFGYYLHPLAGKVGLGINQQCCCCSAKCRAVVTVQAPLDYVVGWVVPATKLELDIYLHAKWDVPPLVYTSLSKKQLKKDKTG